MPGAIELEVATPERQLAHEEVEWVEIPGSNGYMGILPGHAPLVGQLGSGYLTYAAGGRHRHLAVSGGFLEVLPEHVRVMADFAERAEEVDVERARQALARAQEELARASSDADLEAAAAAMHRAEARLLASEKR